MSFIPLASACFNTARMLLNDQNTQLWTDTILSPMMYQAHLELQAKLKARASPNMKSFQTLVISPGTVQTTLPLDMTSPIKLWEKPVGSPISAYDPMTESDFVPITQVPGNNLGYWCWLFETLNFIGSVLSIDVLILYWRRISPPVVGSDSTGLVSSEQYLGPRIASIAASSVGEDNTSAALAALAEQQLGAVIAANRGRGPLLPGNTVRP